MGRRAVVPHARSPAPPQESLPDTPLAHNIGPFNPALYLSYTPDKAQVSSQAVDRLRCWQIVTGCSRSYHNGAHGRLASLSQGVNMTICWLGPKEAGQSVFMNALDRSHCSDLMCDAATACLLVILPHKRLHG